MTQQDRNQDQQRDNVAQQDHNETQQIDNVSQQVANEDLAPLIRDLTVEIRQLRSRFRGYIIERVVLWLVVAAIILLGTLYYVDVLNRRKAALNNTKELACTIVTAFPRGTAPVLEDLRAKYGPCPAYVHRASGPLPAVTSTRTVAGSTVVVVTPTPVPGRTVTVPGPTVTRTVIAEVLGPTRTVTVTATATRTCAALICLGG